MAKPLFNPLTPWQGRVSETAAGCLVWQGAINRRGYPVLGSYMAHRLVYELEVGPIPIGMTLDHLCGVPACVNPEHLEVVTASENLRRAHDAWRALGETGPSECKRGHLRTQENTYVSPKGALVCRDCRSISQREWRERNPDSASMASFRPRYDADRATAGVEVRNADLRREGRS